MEKKYLRSVKNSENIYMTKYGIDGIYTKQMDAPYIVGEEYGVVESLYNTKISTGGFLPQLAIKMQTGEKMHYDNKKGFKVGDEIVYIGTIFNRPATQEEIEEFEEISEIEGVKFVPVCTNEIYLASEYEQMKKNGGPKR